MKEAEHDKRLVDIEFTKQSQNFESNPKLREVLEARRSKSERVLNTTRSEYAKAARETEPLLRRLSNENQSEALARKIVKAELDDFVMFRDLDREMEVQLNNLERKLLKRIPAEARIVVNEMKGFALQSDFDKLEEQVKGMGAKRRPASESSDDSRGFDHIVAQGREVANLQKDLVSRTTQLDSEIISLKEKVNNMQKDKTLELSRRMQMTPVTKSDDVVKVYRTRSLISQV